MIVCELNRTFFCFGDNGLLQSVRLPDEYGNREMLAQPFQLLVNDGEGAPLRLTADESTVFRKYANDDGSITLLFSNIAFAGREDLKLGLKHELYPDGVFFTYAFLCGNCCQPKPLARFELKMEMALAPEDTVRNAVFYRPKCADGTLIQTSAPNREVKRGENQIFEDSILPLTEFMVETEAGPTYYAEFFVEGDGSVAGKNEGTASSLCWKNGNAVLSWNFQTCRDVPAGGVWQWRNTWGGVIAPAVRQRHFAPFVMYHYFDNFKRYPSADVLKAIAEAGADVLILHENWRLDIQNGGIPFDYAELERVVKTAHDSNIRIALYMRGNELSVLEEQMNWFKGLLKPDYDGLYMDYGGPFHYICPPDEMYPGGRIAFRRHYNECRLRRQRIGRGGIHFSHTGPMFSALGMMGGLVDGYVSGEGERGLLLRSRFDNMYYSMAPVCSGSLWSAAFPEYGSAEMLPFLAATGQFPHLPLGTQFKTSSLSHPEAPGIADMPFKQLWRLWQLMKDQTDLQVRNDYNSVGIFPRQKDISHYLMFTDKLAVCIFANFSSDSQEVNPEIAWEKAGVDISGKKMTRCQNLQINPVDGMFVLPPKGVAAIVVGDADFDAYVKPLPPLCETAKAHLAVIEEQRQMRQATEQPHQWRMRLTVPDIPMSYERSMIVDLYDNRFVFGVRDADGTFKRLGFIGKNGYQENETSKEEFVVNGQSSPWVNLNEILETGVHHVAIQSLHRGEVYYTNTPFYSFIEAELVSETGERRIIRFMNELEDDRSFLNFAVKLG